MKVSVSKSMLGEILRHLLTGGNEEVAFLFAFSNGSHSGLSVHRWSAVPREKLLVQEPDRFAIDASFVAGQVKTAKNAGESILLAHSHPSPEFPPFFSYADDLGEQALYRTLRMRCPGVPHGAIVASPRGIICRVLPSYRATTEAAEFCVIP